MSTHELVPRLDQDRIAVVPTDWHEVTIADVSCVQIQPGTALDHALHLSHLGSGRGKDRRSNQRPCLFRIKKPSSTCTTHSPGGPTVSPDNWIHCFVCPAHLRHEFVHSWVLFNALCCNSNANHLSRFSTRNHRICGYHLHPTVHSSVATERMKHVPNPRTAFNRRGANKVFPLPNRKNIREKIENDHSSLWNTTYISIQLLFPPESSVVHEQPALHKPDCLWIGLSHGSIHGRRRCSKVLQFGRFACTGTWTVFVERIGRVDVICAVYCSDLFYKGFTQSTKERVFWTERQNTAITSFKSTPVAMTVEARRRMKPKDCLGNPAGECR
mmetsp:Transcript_72926/g.194671  ORF Transcript_72926/g.194671 Transcript_72926/m.194671 type:complete len:328 (-) Transcript_72926:860-1843(-)